MLFGWFAAVSSGFLGINRSVITMKYQAAYLSPPPFTGMQYACGLRSLDKRSA